MTSLILYEVLNSEAGFPHTEHVWIKEERSAVF